MGSCRFCGLPRANPSSIFHYHVVPFAKESLKSLTKDQRHRWGIHPRRDRMGLSQRFSRPKGDCRNQGCYRGGCVGLAKSAWSKSDANLQQHTIPSEIRVHNSLSFTYVVHSYCLYNQYILMYIWCRVRLGLEALWHFSLVRQQGAWSCQGILSSKGTCCQVPGSARKICGASLHCFGDFV